MICHCLTNKAAPHTLPKAAKARRPSFFATTVWKAVSFWFCEEVFGVNDSIQWVVTFCMDTDKQTAIYPKCILCWNIPIMQQWETWVLEGMSTEQMTHEAQKLFQPFWQEL